MTTKNNGGPAFPCEKKTGMATYNLQTCLNEFVYEPFEGMSLRDYAAIKMMAAFAADAKRGPDTVFMNYEIAAREAYAMADAVLAERDKP